jgi:hypothetical protein
MRNKAWQGVRKISIVFGVVNINAEIGHEYSYILSVGIMCKSTTTNMLIV